MAEEEKNVVEKGSKSDFIKIVAIGVVIFCIALGASYFVLRNTISPLLPPDTSNTSAESTLGTPFEVGEFTTNINDVSGPRFMKVKVTIALSSTDKKATEEATKYKPVIRDTILGLISSKSVADFDHNNRNNLKEEIKKEVNAKLGKDLIQSVYFEDIIIQ